MTLKSPLELIHGTPMLKLEPNISAKLEYLNLSGSIKDRMVNHMIETAEKKGQLKKGMTIVEASSGNTGIAVSTIGKLKGYGVKVFMPKRMSEERKVRMRLMGANLILTKNMDEAKQSARELGERKGHFYLNQFGNHENSATHALFTGLEIIRQARKVDAFLAGVGTGGTIMGVGRALRKHSPKAKIIALFPRHKNELIEGIDHYYSEEIYDPAFADEVVKVSRKDALKTTREILHKYGLFVGESSGANYFAAKKLPYKNIVTIFADSGDRYWSTGLWK